MLSNGCQAEIEKRIAAMSETSTSITEHLTARPTWIRGLFILLFAIIYRVAGVVLAAVAIVQFGFVLFTGQRNERLLGVGESLGRFYYQVARYVTFNTEERPFPFSDWPGAAPSADADQQIGDAGYP